MESISFAKKQCSNSTLFKLLGKQLVEPSFGVYQMAFLMICEAVLLILYPTLLRFSPQKGLKLEANISDFEQKNYKAIIMAVLIPLSVIFVTAALILFIFNYFQNSEPQQEKNSIGIKFVHRSLNRINVMMRTFLFMPLLHLLIAIFQLDIPTIIPKQAVIFVGVLGVIEFIILFIFLCILTEVSNPFSLHPWASSNCYGIILKSLLKTLFVIFLQYGTPSTIKIFFALQGLICIGWLLIGFFIGEKYTYLIKIIQRSILTISLWNCIFVLISDTSHPENKNSEVAFLFFGMVLLGFCINFLFSFIENKQIQQFENAKKQLPILTGIVSTINSIQNKDYYKLFSKHAFSCQNNDCCCRKITAKISKQQEILEQDYYYYLEQLIRQKIQLLQQKTRIRILLSYIYLQKMHMKNSSIVILNELKQDNTLNIYSKFKVECLQITIFSYIQQLSQKNNIQLQIEKCFTCHKKYSDLRFIMFKICNKIIDFWKNINTKEYNMKMVHLLNRQIINQSKLADKQFLKLRELNPSSKEIIIQFIEFRKYYLSEDTTNYEDDLSVLKKNIEGQGKYLDPMSALFLNTSKPGILVVTANEYNFNKVHYANSHLLLKTSYFQRDVVGKSLQIFIPTPFRSNHAEGMKNYLLGNSVQKSPSSIKIHMFGSSSNILIGSMTVSLLNDISEGLLFIGLINFQQNTEKLIFVSDRGQIYGINLQFLNQFGKILQNNISSIMPNLNWKSIIFGNTQHLQMVIITQIPHEYQNIESQPMSYQIRIRLKETRTMKKETFYVFSIESTEKQLTIINVQPQISSQSNISEINLEQSNNQLQVEVVNNMLQQTIFKKKQPLRMVLMNVLGIITKVILISLTLFNAYHFIQQINLMIQQYNSLLSLSKTNLRIVDNSILARRLNTYAYFNDTKRFLYYEKYYNVSILKMNSVYYDTNSMILKLKGMGFDDSDADLRTIFWSYPNSKEQTQLYNLLTMYIQSVTYLDNIFQQDFAFDPIRIYNGSFTIFKSQLQDVVINTYASILPKFDVITPAINGFWKERINSTDFSWYLILGFVIVYLITLTLFIFFVDYFYVLKYEKIVNIMGEFSKSDINYVISNIENYQYKMFKQYYENNWIKALFYLFEDNDPTKKIRSSHDVNLVSANTSNILTPMQQDTKLRKKSKNKSSKQVNQQDDKKAPYNLKYKYRTHRHFFLFIFSAIIIIVYFITDFALVRIYMNKLIVTTDQLGQILQRLKLISSMRFVTYDSLFELTPWPTNISLVQQAKQYSNQLFFNQQKLQSAQVTYPEWTNQIFKMNKVDLCSNIKYYAQNNDYYPTHSDCLSIFNGTLTKGFSLALSTFANAAQNIYLQSSPNMTIEKLSSIIHSENFIHFNNISQMLMSSTKFVRNIYLTIMVDKYATYGDSFKQKAFIFSVVLLLLILLWLYVVRRMNRITEAIKGLLKIITVTKIQKNQKLKKELISSNVISSLK